MSGPPGRVITILPDHNQELGVLTVTSGTSARYQQSLTGTNKRAVRMRRNRLCLFLDPRLRCASSGCSVLCLPGIRIKTSSYARKYPSNYPNHCCNFKFQLQASALKEFQCRIRVETGLELAAAVHVALRDLPSHHGARLCFHSPRSAQNDSMRSEGGQGCVLNGCG